MSPEALARRHLDRRLEPLRANAAALARPPRGWVRAIRDALGMTTRQFASRLGVAQSVAVDLERRELRESVSLGTLRQAAEALDCRLVYALVPNRSLEDTLLARARQQAAVQLAHAHHTMSLEDQALSAANLAAEGERLAAELARGDPRRLWDEL
jgi:predicted DNA-binding mobile mystery protein A